MRYLSLLLVSLTVATVHASNIDFTVNWQADLNNDDFQFRLIPDVTFSEGNMVAVATKGVIMYMNATTGKRYWKRKYNFKISCGAAIDSSLQQIYICTQDGRIIAISLENKGKIVWQSSLLSESVIRPTVTNEGLHVRTKDGKITTLSLSDGSTSWTYFHTASELSLSGGSELKQLGRYIVYGTDTGKIIILASKRGNLIFELPITTPSLTSDLLSLSDVDGDIIVLPQGTLIASAHNGPLIHFNINTGEFIWKTKNASFRNSALLSSDRVFSLLQGNKIQAFSLLDGKSVYLKDIESKGVLNTAMLYKEYILIGDTNGRLHIHQQDNGDYVNQIIINDRGYTLKKFKLFQHPDDENSFIAYDLNGRLFSLQIDVNNQ